jgi:hypothetical protein
MQKIINMRYLLFALIIISFSCNSTLKRQNEINTTKGVDFDSVKGVPEYNNKLIESDLWIIKNHEFGPIKSNSQLESSISKIKEYFEVSLDSIDMTDSGYGEGLEYFYNVRSQGELLFIIHPDNSLKEIQTIEVVSNEFKTDKGYKVGFNYGELKKLYIISSSSFDYDYGLFVYAKDFAGTFHLKTEELDTYNIDSIPLNITIDIIVIY